MLEETVTTPAVVDTNVAATPPGGTGGKPWYDGADTETIGYLTNRGLDKKDAKDVALETIKAHREAQKMLGVPSDQILRFPKDAADEAGWKAVYAKLGVPGKAEDYDVKAATDPDFGKSFQAAALANNLTKAQAEGILKDVQKYTADKTSAADAERQAQIQNEQTALKKDWGFNWEANRMIARNAATKLGITPEAIEAIEKGAGYKATMSALLKVGQAIGEARFVTSETTGNVLTVEGAVARKAELMRDTTWAGEYLAGKAGNVREMTSLNTIIASGMK